MIQMQTFTDTSYSIENLIQYFYIKYLKP